MSPPPPGVYVPAVLFLDQNEELDEEAIKQHILRLAQVSILTGSIQIVTDVRILDREASLAFLSRAVMAKPSSSHMRSASAPFS